MSTRLFSDEQPTDPPSVDAWNAAISAAVDVLGKDVKNCKTRGLFYRQTVCNELINQISCLKR